MECFMPYFALLIMFYHVKIACYQCVQGWCDALGWWLDFSVASFGQQPYTIWMPCGCL